MNFEQTLEEARQALYADKWKVAITLTTKILDADQTCAEAWLIKARAFEKQHGTLEAEIDALTSPISTWYERFGTGCDAVLEKDAKFASHVWIFGASGRTRSAAQQAKKRILAELDQ
jgi:hypothetical protein